MEFSDLDQTNLQGKPKYTIRNMNLIFFMTVTQNVKHEIGEGSPYTAGS